MVGEHYPRYAPPASAPIHSFLSSGRARYSLLLALIAALVPLNRIWAVQALLILLMLSVPGALLLRVLRIPGRTIGRFPALVPCASVVVLLTSGLAVDLVGLAVRSSSPLRTIPLLVTLELTCILLLIFTPRESQQVDIPWKSLTNPASLAWPLALPLIAALGAIRLNNGHSNKVAIVAILLCVVVLILSMIFAWRMRDSVLKVVVYSVGLAMMWSYSLRGTLVYGFDIATEYERLNSTIITGIWHPTHHNDAYGAMLSLTVMPAEMHSISGLSALMILKIVFPMIGALFPLEIFTFGRWILSRPWSVAAAGFTIAQATFSQQLPGLARQEVALALFGALVSVLFFKRLSKPSQWCLVALLSLALVVSHYSTTYVTIIIFGLTILLQWILSWFCNIERITGTIGLAFVVTLVGALIWYGPITKSATGVAAVGQTVSSQGLDLFPTQSPGQNPIMAYFQSGQQTMSASQYQQAVHNLYAQDDTSIIPLLDAGLPRYNLRSSSPSSPPVKLKLVQSAVNLTTLITQQLLNLLGGIGAVVMIFRRNAPVGWRRMGLFGFATALFLVLVRISGTLAIFYNSERALLQALGVFSISFCWTLESFAGRRPIMKADRYERWRAHLHRQQIAAFVVAMFLLAFVANSIGLLGAILGGGTGTNLANSGEDYERYYRTQQEVGSADWLTTQVRSGQLVYADRYGQLTLIAATGITNDVIGDITPLTINQNAWVYATSTNTIDGRARTTFQNYLVTYAFPAAFLNANFDLVYSNGSSEVFFR